MSPPPASCFPARQNLSSICRPGSIPIPIHSRSFRRDLFARLPQPSALAALVATAATSYGAPSPAHVVAGPGSQILAAQTAFLLARGRASVLAPTYAEHGRVAELAGHNVVEVAEVAQLAEARIAIVVNPNNPDGRLVAKDALLALADRLRRRGGLLLVDEAFMEVGPEGASLARSCRGGQHRRAALIRQILWSARSQTELCPGRTGNRCAHRNGARAMACLERCARHRRGGARRR